MVYRHPNANVKEFIDEFNDTLVKLNSKNANCIVLGDFNINILQQDIEPAASYINMQWRGNVFWTGGAQNSKIVSTSGGRSPPDPPFFRTHVFESRTLSRPILIDINCMPA